ncbi:hypothetical protein OBBRIDRAFT_883178 [Obba rivulosa]|uniref:DNA helicase Pif1-like 2B domain-containing protein n=1 Tax=Obba rivulosa TaxID=1052685 RepID=A0A8E2J772_9APHY|nr:hypothetical protein OBBRIDRAFT_883178 [Obba rivulosa]
MDSHNELEYTYRAKDRLIGTSSTKQQNAPLLANFTAPKKLTLRIGSEVMLITDLDRHELVSGTKGVVVDFQKLSVVYADPSEPWGAEDDCHGQTLPLVQFEMPGTNKKRYVLVTPVGYYAEGRDTRTTSMSRMQLPLIQAIPRHASQLEKIMPLKVTLTQGPRAMANGRHTWWL